MEDIDDDLIQEAAMEAARQEEEAREASRQRDGVSGARGNEQPTGVGMNDVEEVQLTQASVPTRSQLTQASVHLDDDLIIDDNDLMVIDHITAKSSVPGPSRVNKVKKGKKKMNEKAVRSPSKVQIRAPPLWLADQTPPPDFEHQRRS